MRVPKFFSCPIRDIALFIIDFFNRCLRKRTITFAGMVQIRVAAFLNRNSAKPGQ